jgi:DNA-binding PadR family transcriptional regulator
VSELDVIRVRDEVLQAMYWMYAEGLGDAPSPPELARFLAVSPETLAPYLERFVNDGYLERAGERYRLTPAGAELGKRTFAAEFAGLTGQAHGECSDPDCWCHESPEEAARCLEERLEQQHAG